MNDGKRQRHEPPRNHKKEENPADPAGASRRAKISVFVRNFRGARGYDLVVRDENASVQDYLDALTEAIATLPLTRLSRRRQDCFGCDRCCAERAPLTAVDCRFLMKATGERDPGAFLEKYASVSVDGPVVDIVLKPGGNGRCVFLDRQTKLCRVYDSRPLVCRTYICSPAARRALALRAAVVNKGEDELVRLWFKTGMVIHQARNPRPDLRDWPPTPFAGKKSYREVLLREVLPSGLWRRIAAPSHTAQKSAVKDDPREGREIV